MSGPGRGDQTPLFRDAWRLVTWIQAAFDRDPRPLARRVCGLSLDLMESVTLALAWGDGGSHLERADDRLRALRVFLRMSRERGMLDERQLVHALSLADPVGRQIGGWIRSLGAG